MRRGDFPARITMLDAVCQGTPLLLTTGSDGCSLRLRYTTFRFFLTQRGDTHGFSIFCRNPGWHWPRTQPRVKLPVTHNRNAPRQLLDLCFFTNRSNQPPSVHASRPDLHAKQFYPTDRSFAIQFQSIENLQWRLSLNAHKQGVRFPTAIGRLYFFQ